MSDKHNQFNSVMDLAKQGAGQPDADFTGVFEHDPAEVAKWGHADQSYDGEFKYVNKTPMELKRLLESETDEEEIRLLNIALEYWMVKEKTCMVGGGEPYRGEERDVDRPDCLRNVRKTQGEREKVSGSFKDVAKEIESGEMGGVLGTGQQVGLNWEES